MAYMIAALVLLSLASFVAVIIGTSVGAGENDGFSQGAWPSIIMLPLFALPVAMILTIALLIVSTVKRSKRNGNPAN
ncbi:MAG: hypothetical protein JWP30_918 [Homoserinimonas sp.]|jgi:Ni/Fe-hydrogenase subunit HybB-like protein|nr:hypothetical protein [Homoserinimonas sp.]